MEERKGNFIKGVWVKILAVLVAVAMVIPFSAMSETKVFAAASDSNLTITKLVAGENVDPKEEFSLKLTTSNYIYAIRAYSDQNYQVQDIAAPISGKELKIHPGETLSLVYRNPNDGKEEPIAAGKQFTIEEQLTDEQKTRYEAPSYTASYFDDTTYKSQDSYYYYYYNNGRVHTVETDYKGNRMDACCDRPAGWNCIQYGKEDI